MTASARVALALAILVGLGPRPARAHEILHEVARGKAVAVKAFLADGEVLAYQAYEVYSPADPRIAWQKGRTDRAGWLAFVPDTPGRWRVKVIDESGHGLELEVEAASVAAPAALADGRPGSTLAFVLRPLVGLAVIGAVFAGLVLARRRRRSRP